MPKCDDDQSSNNNKRVEGSSNNNDMPQQIEIQLTSVRGVPSIPPLPPLPAAPPALVPMELPPATSTPSVVEESLPASARVGLIDANGEVKPEVRKKRKGKKKKKIKPVDINNSNEASLPVVKDGSVAIDGRVDDGLAAKAAEGVERSISNIATGVNNGVPVGVSVSADVVDVIVDGSLRESKE